MCIEKEGKQKIKRIVTTNTIIDVGRKYELWGTSHISTIKFPSCTGRSTCIYKYKDQRSNVSTSQQHRKKTHLILTLCCVWAVLGYGEKLFFFLFTWPNAHTRIRIYCLQVQYHSYAELILPSNDTTTRQRRYGFYIPVLNMSVRIQKEKQLMLFWVKHGRYFLIVNTIEH